MAREDRGRDSGSAAEEWAEVEAGRGQAPAAEERGLGARAEAAERVRAEVCGTPAPAVADPGPAAGTGPVVAQGLVVVQGPAAARVQAEVGLEDREAEAELGLGRVARVAGLAPVEVGERERVRVVAQELARARVEADSAEVEPALVQALVLVLEAEELEAEVVRVPGLERAEAELARAERERQEDG